MRNAMVLALAAALALALALGAGAARADGKDCIGRDCKGNKQLREFEIVQTTEGGTAKEARRCSGVYWVLGLSDRTDARDPLSCYGVEAGIDCSGNIVGHRYGDIRVCASVNAAWTACCTPDSRMGNIGGFCDLVDYYGNRIRLKVEVPPHRFRIVPYPVGFVAREDPWGVFHPTARLVWESPPFPQDADSGWRLWSWGGNRGPGRADFPCDLDGAGLFARNIPAGTECLRLQLWASPGFDAALNPTLLPALLQFPAARLNESIWPGRTVAIHFPYASHPATGQVSEVRFGEETLPAFNGYFHRWWPVRLRVEKKRVVDLTGTETRCEAVAADEKGKPKESGDCWTLIGDPPTLWPGRSKTETVVKGKAWETEERDGILILNAPPFNRPWPYLHPDRALIRDGEGRTWRTGVVVRGGYPWLYLPLAVREGQGAVTR